MKFLDAHAHIQFPIYDADRDNVILRAREADVAMINVGTQVSSSRAAIKLAEENQDDLWAAVGFHPAHCNDEWHHDTNEQSAAAPEIFDITIFEELARHPKVVAIGECGLDYFARDKEQETSDKVKEKQKEIFLAQIEIAKKVEKPLMIHCRDAFPDLIEILTSSLVANRFLPSPGIIHFFTGTPDDARALIDLGFSFTFGGAITFPPRKEKTINDYDEVIRLIPLDRILSETDAPYVSPAPYRGKRNEPAYVVETVKKLAEIKNVSAESAKDQIWKNAQKIFNI